MARKLAPLPNIDLGATFKIIDDSTAPPRWKTVGRGYATQKAAQQFIHTHNLSGIWMVDDCGYKTYVSRLTTAKHG